MFGVIGRENAAACEHGGGVLQTRRTAGLRATTVVVLCCNFKYCMFELESQRDIPVRGRPHAVRTSKPHELRP